MTSRRGLLACVFAVLILASPVAQTRPPALWVDAGRGVTVSAEGRILPLETWAQVVYARVSGREHDPAALEWFLTLLAFPESLEDHPFFLVNDPTLLAGTGVAITTRGWYSPRTMAPLFPLADEWANRFAEDPSPGGRELLRLARAVALYRDLVATFGLDQGALRSPFVCLFPVGGALNPAQALGTPGLAVGEKDRLALLLYWRDRSRAGVWTEAAQALGLFAGHATTLELFHNAVPWAPLTGLFVGLGLGLAWVFRRKPRAWAPLT